MPHRVRFIFAIGLAAAGWAQQPPPIGVPHVDLGAGPFVFDTAEQHKIRVVVVTKGLSHPWSLAFLPDGNLLITERAGRLRIVRDGVLDPQPLAGVPKVHAVRNAGLFDIALHPKFADNKLVYFTYSKPGENSQQATILARGRLDRAGLTEVRDLFSGEWTTVLGGSRIVFARDGNILMTTGAATGNLAQDPNSDYGKVLRLREDGTVPSDNPFVGRSGYKPEIYTLGHRDQLGLTVHPQTGAIYSNENGPNGGDEINLILAGRNYGWPLISYGRAYDGPRISDVPWRDGIEQPLVYWVPSIALSGMTFYSGDRFPAWKGNVFVGGMRQGEIPGTGRLERVVFNDKMEELRRESLLTDLKQRIRDVRQGPDGLLYVLTEEENGALLRIEPAP
ncbi:MAG TPA: PQQ-dependent sugar dehydrogenase [Bryobacteraceae bacterium]|jgi:glucose/arabinose dehydrogenase|nr:PQQ-dependent sugar dehydrogenase [Bryobacteraceae bacterium]